MPKAKSDRQKFIEQRTKVYEAIIAEWEAENRAELADDIRDLRSHIGAINYLNRELAPRGNGYIRWIGKTAKTVN